MTNYSSTPTHPADRVATAKARLAAFEADAAEVPLGTMRVAEAARTTRAIDHRRGRLTSALEEAEAALAARERSDAEAASMDPRQLAAQVSRGW